MIDWKLRKELKKRKDFNLSLYKRHTRIYLCAGILTIILLDSIIVIALVPTLINLLNQMLKKSIELNNFQLFFSTQNLFFLFLLFLFMLFIVFYKMQFPNMKKYLVGREREDEKTVEYL